MKKQVLRAGWKRAGQTKSRLALILLIVGIASTAQAQTTSFAYQGRLIDAGAPANGPYDLQFGLWDSVTGGAQIGVTQTLLNVSVSNGSFGVTLDFGAAAFPGANRFLEISVRPAGGGTFTLLTPREQITSTPYAIRSLNSTASDALSSVCVGCVTSAQVGSVAGSAISGSISVVSITANTIDATTQYNIAGSRVLSTAGSQNIFAGVNAGPANTIGFANSFFGFASGQANTSGSSNSFFGHSAGQANVDGSDNSFFGEVAGSSNTTGDFNAFFGARAGQSNTSGAFNSFFGGDAGRANTSGASNSFFGLGAGFSNTTGSENAFFGSGAGNSNTSGHQNAFFGAGAGVNNTTGVANAFFGHSAGFSNTTGTYNNFFGTDAGLSNTTGFSNAFFGGLAGEFNTTGSSNSFFGIEAGETNTTGLRNAFFGARSGNANTTASNNSFFGNEAGEANTTGPRNAFFGNSAGVANTTGANNAIFGNEAGEFNTSGGNNSFFGEEAGGGTTTGSSNSFFGQRAGSSNGTGTRNTLIGAESAVLNTNFTNATAIGANAAVNQSNSLVLGSINGLNSATADTKVGIGTPSPNERLTVQTATSNFGFVHTDGLITVGSYVGGSTAGGWYGTKTNHPLSFFVNNGSPSMTIATNGQISITTLGTGGATSLCRNGLNVISTCSSSLRYKTNLALYSRGLEVINRLRPITFDWKEGGMHDVGFGAEDVAKIDPLLVTYNDKGQVEGVKYDRITVALTNAVNQQQSEIEKLQTANAALNARLKALEKLLEKKADQ